MAALSVCGPQQIGHCLYTLFSSTGPVLQAGRQAVSHIAPALASILSSISESPIGYQALAFNVDSPMALKRSSAHAVALYRVAQDGIADDPQMQVL